MKLDIGEIPTAEAGTEDDDPTRAVRITAHAVARVADRLPFSRKISRHMEGQENRAGVVADLLSLLVELVRRNPDLIEQQVSNFSANVQRAKEQRAAQAQSQSHPTQEGTNASE